ncbi:hypothetical protein F975_01888 [Acinetobacter sp. ANC 3789]|uniref:ORF6N domain-containing protein n=1 Tax=Acinetobacter sp. ANC 3789 TaxID=1217714 RepID=UPI0002D07DE0|nr:ORF6N domain-containing protein [Acinetobacter sp. ANC 3789]ENU80135.1 hypothetical protein F975_01888 [Acinetobacter sp. ANC 3789]
MSNIAQINDTKVSIINFKSIPVVTTEMLADFYGTDIDNIRQNFSRNVERFVEGKHFYKLEGSELKAFKNSVTNCHAVKKNARIVNLWTERGAARHAKMLDTDQAWEVFEKLEDCYFAVQTARQGNSKAERVALNDAVNMLVAKTKHLNFSEAYKLIHQRFAINGIDEIPYDMLPIAVAYVHQLIALFSQDKQTQPDQHADATARHMLWLNHWWSEFGSTIIKLSPSMGHGIHDHFKFGAESARQVVGRDVYMPIFELSKTHNWHGGGMGYKQLKECGLVKVS